MHPQSDPGGHFIADIAAATGLLTRLPVRVDAARATARGARAAWAYPVAGLWVGAAGAAIAWAGMAVGLPVTLVAVFALAVQIVVTGALHEDGLADCADGFWGGYTPTRRLEIMKDSRIGTYGVLAIVLVTLARWSAITTLLAAGWVWPLIVVGALSRVPMVWIMQGVSQARPAGLSASVGKPGKTACVLAALIGFGACTFLGWAAIPVIVAVILAAGAVAWVARRKVDGQTGDVLGACQQLCDVAALAVLAGLA